MLRLGILPGEVSRSEASYLLTASADRAHDVLQTAVNDDTIGTLIDRITETYPDQVVEDDVGFWEGAAQLLNTEWAATTPRFDQLIAVNEALADILLNVSVRAPELRWKATSIALQLSRTDDLALTPYWLFRHFFVHGLFKARADGGRAWFFDAETTNNVATNLGGQWRDQLTSGGLLPRLVNAYPLFVMRHTGAWNDACRNALQEQLPDHIVRLAAVLFPSGSITEGDIIEQLCGYKEFKSAVNNALKKNPMSESASNALRRASSF